MYSINIIIISYFIKDYKIKLIYINKTKYIFNNSSYKGYDCITFCFKYILKVEYIPCSQNIS